MTELRFGNGEIIFREGDDSATVAQLISGEVEVVRAVGAGEVVLGRVGPGQFVGEMGALERRRRSATVRAIGEVVLRMLSREAFLERISSDKDMALSALLRLSERLHAMDDRVASGVIDRPAPEREPAELPVTLYADSDTLSGSVPREGIRIASFPFHVGRRPGGHEQPAAAPVALLIDDHRPYRLSRLHFSILRAGDGYAIGDLLSTLGTEVNGEYLGETFAKARTPLVRGQNRVVAGGIDSPYVFRVVVG